MVDFSVAPERTALINVDMQNAFVEGYPLSAPDGLNVLARVNRLSAACRRAGVLVVHTRSVFRPDGSNLGIVGEIDPRSKKGLLFEGSKGADLHAHLAVASSDIILNKPRFGAFHDTDLDLILRSRGVDTVYITGIATNVCCDTTAREASVRGYRVLFASDGTATLPMGGVSPAELQAATCATLAQVFAQITTVDDMIAKVGGVEQTSSNALSDGLEKAVARTHDGSRRFGNGDPAPMKDVFSHRSDVMIMGAWGGYECGWTKVGPRLDWAAARFAEERNATSERLAAGESGDLAYEIFLEKADTRLAGAEGFHPMALRVTHIYRREQGEWKIVQRHADFLTPRAVIAAAPFVKGESLTGSRADDSAAKEFLSKWERAWNNHDAHQLCLLHTPDANTVNRHGTLVQGHEALEKALGFLHGVAGPYHAVTAPPLQLIDLRQIAPNVMILQASWNSPVMNPDGKLDLAKQNDMVVSYTLLKEGGDWRATQVDLHNVEKMDLPYSNAGQKP